MTPPSDLLRTAIKLIVPQGSVTEMRALGTAQGIVSGYFDDPEALAQAAADVDGLAKGVLLMLNPVQPDLLARTNNRAIARPERTTSDSEITRRLWLMVDFDAKRSSGISATDGEHALAIAKARECREWLRSIGWADPLFGDSGNGAHLLYRIDLPNDAESTALIKNILIALGVRFSDAAVEVDPSTYNAARLTKFYGTMARKGSHTNERPHRRSGVIDAPAHDSIVSLELLKTVAGMAPEAPAPSRTTMAGTSLDMDKWLADRGVPIRKHGPWGTGGYKWVLELCPWNGEHTDGAAFIVKLHSGAIAAGCLHSSCAGKGWRDLRDKWEPDWRTRRERPAGEEGPWEEPIPFSSPSLPPFPSATFPMWLRSFVEGEAEATQTPPDLTAMLALAVLAAALAKKVRVLARKGWSEPLNLFTVTALPPGNRKSGVFQDSAAPLNEYEQEQIRMTAPQIAEAVSRRKIAEVCLQKAEAAAANAKPEDRSRLMVEATRMSHELESAKIPVAPRLIADDTSSERLATLLRDQGGRMAVMSPEGDAFDLMAGRYTNGAANFGVYLKGHAGDALRVDRVGRPPEFVKEPALTMGLAIQPGMLNGLIKKPGFRDRGLLARILFSLPVSLVGRRSLKPQPLSDEIRAAYHHGVWKLLESPFGTDQDGEPSAHVLQFSAEADDALHAFETWLEPQLADGGALGNLQDWAAKLAGAVVRISGILHMADFAEVEGPWQYPIQGPTVERAIHIGKYAIAHARAAFEAMGADPDIESARRVLDWIQARAGSSFTKRDLFNGTRAQFPSVKDLDPALKLLDEHGFIRQRPEEGHPGPGRKPSPTYDVNPLYLAQNPQKAQNSGPGEHSADSADSAALPGAATPAGAAPEPSETGDGDTPPAVGQQELPLPPEEGTL